MSGGGAGGPAEPLERRARENALPEAAEELELVLERLDEAGVHAQQSAPCAQLLRAQVMHRRRRHRCDATRNGRCGCNEPPRGDTVPAMALEGLHHITAITADAPANVDFYA